MKVLTSTQIGIFKSRFCRGFAHNFSDLSEATSFEIAGSIFVTDAKRLMALQPGEIFENMALLKFHSPK